jgi:ATP-dependent DNA ligase
VLWANGADVTSKTLVERRAVLESIIKPAVGMQLGNYVEGQG